MMPTLANPRHEAFCNGLARGMTASAAYVSAGFAPNRGNAARLKANECIQTRLRELLQRRTDRIVDMSELNARSVLTRLMRLSDEAASSGNHRVAIEALFTIAKCLGYVDNPTYLQEQLGVTRPTIATALRAPRANEDMAKIIAKFSAKSRCRAKGDVP